MMTTAMDRFIASVPESEHENVMCILAEATQGYNVADCVDIWDRDRIDSINARAYGVIRIGEDEHVFICQDGNWNGTEILSWDDDARFEPFTRTAWALRPARDIVSEAIATGRGPFLLAKWDAILSRPEVAAIIRNYAYDRMMQPGSLIEKYYKEAAAKWRFEIVPEDEANATREALKEARGEAGDKEEKPI